MQLEKRAKEIQKNSSIICGIINENIQNEEKIKIDLSTYFHDNYEAFEARIPYSNMIRELNNRIHIHIYTYICTYIYTYTYTYIFLSLSTPNIRLHNDNI